MANQGPMTVNPHLFKNVKIDPLAAFDPVTLLAAAPLVVVVPQESPIASLQQLVEGARKAPGKLTYGSAGNGPASHLATLLLAQAAKLEMVHAPYKLPSGATGNGPATPLATWLLAQTAKLEWAHAPYRGAGPAITDVIGGRLDFMITTLPSAAGFIKSGKLKPLAVTTKARSKGL